MTSLIKLLLVLAACFVLTMMLPGNSSLTGLALWALPACILCYTLRCAYILIRYSDRLSMSAIPTLVFLDVWALLGEMHIWTLITIPRINSLLERLLRVGPPCPHVTTSVEQVNENVSVYVYTPDVIAHRGCLLYSHGGGWCFLSARGFSHSVSWISYYLGMVVVSVEYRLAYEHPFPTPLIDCYAALRWVFASATRLGVDPSRVFVCGDSAGGNLSAALCLLNRDQRGETGDPAIAGQILLYPVLQSYTMVHGSMDYNKTIFPSPHGMKLTMSIYMAGRPDTLYHEIGDPACLPAPPKFWDVVVKGAATPENYLRERSHLEEYTPGTKYAELARNSYIFPLHSEDLAGLPPAYVVVAAADTLRDEGEWYARYLDYFGVPTVVMEVKHVHGFMHGYQRNTVARGELLKIKGFIFSIG